DELPTLRDSVEKGELSPDQAEAIARAAQHAPHEQSHLLDTARNEPLTELRKECERVIAAHDPDFAHRHERIWRNRSVGTYRRADGSKTLSATGTPTDIATLESRLRRLLPTIQKLHKDRGETDAGIEAALFDALMHLSSPDAPEETDDDAAAPPSSASCSCGGRPRVVYRSVRDLLFHLSYSAALRGRVLPGELCELDGVGPVPLSEALDFSTDPFVKAVLRDGTDIHKVLHFGRKVPAELRTALEAQGRRCAVPGCANHAWLEVDHGNPSGSLEFRLRRNVPGVVDSAAGGPLALWNAQFLCTYHHRLKSAGRLGDLPPPPAANPTVAAPRGMAAPRAPT
ncbi:MAG: HNH endonuclease, partial [Acidimicrobiia bacterium]|nr:HNH endonuclease [Acidimicrobiia bacterium]